ncbi:2Fe-2S iron-sulfur cluster-binding protein [Pseudonocardia bannensis]|uniref:2Fe-2S iron-sulfur cluster binding domain-containing protein n=1 Tax=Pseudonocardia bannensis TaxID=630973 RepID=A0A848DPQ1_9PSEU|nr:2Fe-2S iron-sulfur cluster-binding protein [Pseudonocardia bannensis]NMH94807.1 2Fe-2S iron-sulfur cluster binding domain-containing protein [Pseudonocardia bannensis]
MPLIRRHRDEIAAFQARRRGRPSLHSLVVEEIRPLTDDAVLVAFTVPDHLREAYRFKHGQHVTVVHRTDAGELRRSYSICAPAGSGGLRVAIRRVPGGAFSGYATEQLRVGDTLAVLTPTGRFTTELDAAAAKHYVAIAGGSGITPILSMTVTILEGEPQSRVTLLYANRSPSSTMFLDELEALRDVHGARLSVCHHWSREAPAGEAGPRRLGPDSVRDLLERCPPVDEWIMCGPLGLVQGIAATLEEHGVDQNTIHQELFTAAGVDDLTNGHDRPLVHSEVTLRMDGEDSTLTLSSRGVSVLAAALPLRPDLPYSCSDGICATCRVKVVEGQVEMDRCSALDRAEIRQGYVLACQAHPISERVLLDFDA